MTYKLLYNDAVAMTGGQRAEGRLDVPALTRLAGPRGRAPGRHHHRRARRRTAGPRSTRSPRVRHRDDFAEAERELAAVDGVTVLIHDDRCAAEERRLRKRGQLPDAGRAGRHQRAGVRGLRRLRRGVHLPVRAAGGHRVRPQDPHPPGLLQLRLHLPEGRLPVVPARRARHSAAPPDRYARAAGRRCAEPEPPASTARTPCVRMPGIGGTGVVTVSQILQMAAHLDGCYAAGLEQTGLAQKGGPVVSDVRISKPAASTGSLRASRGHRRRADRASTCSARPAEPTSPPPAPGHTVAVLNTAMVPDRRDGHRPGRCCPAHRTTRSSRIGRGRPADAAAPGRAGPGRGAVRRPHAGQHAADRRRLPARLPADVAPTRSRRAIRLNGAAVEQNLAAFRWGRAAVVDPAAVDAAAIAPAALSSAVRRACAAAIAAGDYARGAGTRVADLIGYQDETLRRPLRATRSGRRRRRGRRARATEAGERIAVAYAAGLHKLMAYKDEYEVARLHLDPVERARREAEFGAGREGRRSCCTRRCCARWA